MKKQLKELRGELAEKYPPHHHKHLKVFTTFWQLVREVELMEELKEADNARS